MPIPPYPPFRNLSDSNPATPTGQRNIKFQVSGQYTGQFLVNGVPTNFTEEDVSAYVPNLGGVDARTTTSETVGLASQGKLVTFSNASAIAVTLDSTAGAGFFCAIENLGVGTATLTPSSGTINGLASLQLSTNSGGRIFFDGTNWLAVTGGSVTPSAIQQNSYIFATDSGTANNYAVTISPAPTLIQGSGIVFIAAHANTGASTLKVNGGSAITIKKQVTSDLGAGDIAASQAVWLIYDGTNWQLMSKGNAGTAGVRATVTKTTASLANNATETGTVTVAKTFTMMKAVATVQSRIRLYSTVAARDADISRSIGVIVPPDSGLLLELVLNSGSILSYPLSPMIVGANLETSPSAAIAYSITNISGSTSTVGVTFTYLALES